MAGRVLLPRHRMIPLPKGVNMSFLDAAHEPLRRYVYGAGAALVALGVLIGFVTSEQAIAITAVLGALLLVPAVEIARAKVTPVVVAEVEEEVGLDG